jgi:hypothetical protein
MHLVAMSPFYRADQNYARLAHVSDFIKPSPYNNCAGPRMVQYIKNVQSTVFRDFTLDEVLDMEYKLLHLEDQPNEGCGPRSLSCRCTGSCPVTQVCGNETHKFGRRRRSSSRTRFAKPVRCDHAHGRPGLISPYSCKYM